MPFSISTLPSGPLYAGAVFAGATLTSFAGLAVDRLPHQAGWRDAPEPGLTVCAPASRCDACRRPIRWPYLIPVLGYFLAGGRCGACGTRVPAIYPAMEMLGGIGAGMVMALFGCNWTGVAAMLLFLTLLFLGWIDSREQWLPAVVTFPLFWAGLLASPFAPLAADRIDGAFGGCALMWGAMKIVGGLRRVDVTAGGDVALAAAAGAWLGLAVLPYFLLISSAVFVIYALPQRLKGRLMVPMGPALALGLMLSLLLIRYGAVAMH
jgi:leader peptidase (prepilin peptidase) / N-methyltransferase